MAIVARTMALWETASCTKETKIDKGVCKTFRRVLRTARCERFSKFANGVIWCSSGLFATKTEEWVLRTGPLILPLLEHSISCSLFHVDTNMGPKISTPSKKLVSTLWLSLSPHTRVTSG